MLKVGITGGIGSGKTTICRIFETLGIPVFYADTVAKHIMVQDAILMEGVVNAFGPESYLQGGALNNRHIADIVFNNAAELVKLNALVHPAVFRAFDTWLTGLSQDVPYVLKEAALLFESGSYSLCDQNILVIAPDHLKLERVMKRDSVTANAVRARMDKQFADRQKLKMTDHIVYNNENDSLIEQVLALHQLFLNHRA
ncbi:MAG TPA: dephospho-CoA kinase [Pedobacter sp.]|nr:dephospho-CoA kinase [Pedobacter sp.]